MNFYNTGQDMSRPDLKQCWDEVGEGKGRQLGQRGEGGRHDGGGGQQQQGHGGGGLQLGGDNVCSQF